MLRFMGSQRAGHDRATELNFGVMGLWWSATGTGALGAADLGML